MPSKRNQRRKRSKRQNNGAPNVPSNPSLSMVAMPGPTSTHNQTDFIRRQYNYSERLTIIPGGEEVSRTVSFFGAKDSGSDSRCITINDCSYNDALKRDMERNQFFRIYAVEVTSVYSPMSEYGRSPHFVETATSAYEIIRPDLVDDRFKALTTYNCLSIPQNSLVRTMRFNPTAYLKQLGMEWCPCDEFSKFGTHDNTYMDQLKAGYGSSVLIRTRRPPGEVTTAEIGQFWVRFYVEYKGQKGQDSINN